MRTIFKQLSKPTVLIMLLIMVLGISKSQAQDKYSFATYSNKHNGSLDTHYLVVSDPVKNWFKLSKEEQEDWKTNFRTNANRQAGFKLINTYDNIVPYNGDFEKFRSLADCKEKIQDEVFEFKEYYKNSSSDKPVKIIYVNLNQY